MKLETLLPLFLLITLIGGVFFLDRADIRAKAHAADFPYYSETLSQIRASNERQAVAAERAAAAAESLSKAAWEQVYWLKTASASSTSSKKQPRPSHGDEP